jgi:hypothetical protein
LTPHLTFALTVNATSTVIMVKYTRTPPAKLGAVKPIDRFYACQTCNGVMHDSRNPCHGRAWLGATGMLNPEPFRRPATVTYHPNDSVRMKKLKRKIVKDRKVALDEYERNELARLRANEELALKDAADNLSDSLSVDLDAEMIQEPIIESCPDFLRGGVIPETPEKDMPKLDSVCPGAPARPQRSQRSSVKKVLFKPIEPADIIDLAEYSDSDDDEPVFVPQPIDLTVETIDLCADSDDDESVFAGVIKID